MRSIPSGRLPAKAMAERSCCRRKACATSVPEYATNPVLLITQKEGLREEKGTSSARGGRPHYQKNTREDGMKRE